MVQRADIWDALEEGVLAIDESERIIYLNAAARQMLELPVGEAAGQPLHQVYPESTLDRVLHSGKAEYNVPLKSMVHVKILADPDAHCEERPHRGCGGHLPHPHRDGASGRKPDRCKARRWRRCGPTPTNS